MKRIVTFGCEICSAAYQTEAEAKTCESQIVKPVVDVGDIVTCKVGGFGWYDGDRRWIKNAEIVDPHNSGRGRNARGEKCPKRHGNCFDECCSFTFLYVVTAIERELETHRIRYHVETMAMTGKEGWRGGYTYDRHHFTPIKVVRPPASVVKDSRELIGHIIGHLL